MLILTSLEQQNFRLVLHFIARSFHLPYTSLQQTFAALLWFPSLQIRGISVQWILMCVSGLLHRMISSVAFMQKLSDWILLLCCLRVQSTMAQYLHLSITNYAYGHKIWDYFFSKEFTGNYVLVSFRTISLFLLFQYCFIKCNFVWQTALTLLQMDLVQWLGMEQSN
jgi:hypothetical protein